MNIFSTMADKIRTGIQTWLRIQPAQIPSIQLQETLTREGNAIKNRIWYRGDGEELSQFYKQIGGDRTRFWTAVPTPGMEIRKIHVGIPGVITDTLTNIVMADMNDIDLSSKQEEWDEIAAENKFENLLSEAITDTLVVGDGAFKISFDGTLSAFPIIEFYPGEKIDIVRKRGRIKEIVFKSVYHANNQEYVLLETYGKGYIDYTLTKNGKECDLSRVPELESLTPVRFDGDFIMAVPIMFFESSKWKGRGKSIFDGKADAFDSLDEAWSQWVDALRANRTKEYIPSEMIPRNPQSGELLKPNAFDCRFIKTEQPMAEGQAQGITLQQGQIPHESYLATYVTALDLCLQGLISPSTLGIDGNKINDNAIAQREREKATLYTRNKIIASLQEVLPTLINNTLKAYNTCRNIPIEDVDVSVEFGEYASPAFSDVVDVVSKARGSGIMSVERCVKELYGDTITEAEFFEEVNRIKEEQGILELEEPSIKREIDESDT